MAVYKRLVQLGRNSRVCFSTLKSSSAALETDATSMKYYSSLCSSSCVNRFDYRIVNTLPLVRSLEAQGVPSKQAKAKAITGPLTKNVAYSFVSKAEMPKTEIVEESNLSKSKSQVQSSQDRTIILKTFEIVIGAILTNSGILYVMSLPNKSKNSPTSLASLTSLTEAPEILLGAKQYSTAIYMRSVGCRMAELSAKVPLFRGKTELCQLDKVGWMELGRQQRAKGEWNTGGSSTESIYHYSTLKFLRKFMLNFSDRVTFGKRRRIVEEERGKIVFVLFLCLWKVQ